eukprot:TRINITY_DN8233_c0_g1_i1.p1 TRINITY_DN8233_c0_g1~~TRINITY_DN8233_c0_g1_i1.p1  ORF type:complete len:271 (-),score=12.75 TRINITY_DN8233_c0_g1_i1:97-831(-)
MALSNSDIVGYVATVFTLVYFVSPAFTIRKIVQDKSVRSFSAFPFLSGVGNTVGWIYYSVCMLEDTAEHILPNLVINLIGATCMTVYLVIFVAFAKERLQSVVVQVSALVVTLVGFIAICEIVVPMFPSGFVWGEKGTPLKESVCGFVLCFVNIAMYASPLATMGTVIRTKSVEFLPWNMSVVGLVVCFLWSTQGILLENITIWLPNVAGLALSVGQLVLYAVYCRKDRSAREADCGLPLARDA